MRRRVQVAATLLMLFGASCGRRQDDKSMPSSSNMQAAPQPTAQTIDRVRKVLSEQMGVKIEKISMATSLGDVGADELDFVELVMELEDSFEISIPDDRAEQLADGDFQKGLKKVTVHRLAALVDELVAKSSPSRLKSRKTSSESKTMAEMPNPSWRIDPRLRGRFHPQHPDDLEVVIHDGGLRFSENPPEVVWVTVVGAAGRAYRGKLLNQPHGVRSVKQGQEFLFLPVVDPTKHPIQVSEKYLSERDNWLVEKCDRCGFAELFDAPSDLIAKIFPNVDTSQGEELEAFTSFCPLCRGVQVVRKPGTKPQ